MSTDDGFSEGNYSRVHGVTLVDRQEIGEAVIHMLFDAAQSRATPVGVSLARNGGQYYVGCQIGDQTFAFPPDAARAMAKAIWLTIMEFPAGKMRDDFEFLVGQFNAVAAEAEESQAKRAH